jgi:hypothetical protein
MNLDLRFRWILYTTPCTGLPTRIGACGLGDRAILCCPPGSPRSWPVCRNEFSSGRWPASGVVRHDCGCRVDGPLNLQRDRLWVVPCRGLPQTAGRIAVGGFLRTPGWLVSNPCCPGWMPCRQGGKWAISHHNFSGATRRPFADTPRSF